MENDGTLTSDDTSTFDLSLSDDDILQLLRKPVQEADGDKAAKNLATVRESNMNLWLPNHWKGTDVYDYQEGNLYQDNRIYTSVETISAVINARTPQPEISPAQDTRTSNQMAKDLQTVCYAWAKKRKLARALRIGARNLQLKRLGAVKLRWDPSMGKFGDIVIDAVDPADLIIDPDAKWGDVPRFIGQRVRNKTGEELLQMFPDSAQKVYKLLGVKRENKAGDLVAQKTQMGKKKTILELWFRYYDEDKESYGSGLVFCDENFSVVLSKDKNPNWNYEEEDDTSSNILDFPMPPFIPINYLNDGSSWIDLTTNVEQAAPLQKSLDKRGFQIGENADQASGGRIYNTNMITKEEIAKLTGSPDESVGVKGNVRDAVTRDAPPPLANYVVEDKLDARNEIDNIFATHDISRGQESNNKTLGQDQLQQGQDFTRMDDISRALEESAADVFRYYVQMAKVYYTDDHWFQAKGEDGQFDFVVMKADFIEDGIDVGVEAGSMKPINRVDQKQAVTQLAQSSMIDPLTLYEVMAGGTLPSPKKMLERFMAYTTNPQEFLQGATDEDFDRKAFMDIQILNRGEMPKVRNDVSTEYLDYFNKYMVGGDFEGLEDKIKVMYGEWMAICQAQAQHQLEAMMTQAPTPEEGMVQNQQAAQQSALEQQMMGGKPGAGAPAPGGPANPNDLAAQMAQAKPA